MPVYVNGNASNGSVSDSPCLNIGLLNNMPDSALEATERQFLNLLDSAANGVSVRLLLYALPDVPRTVAGRTHLSRFYSGIENLWRSQLDGLIVTGREPVTRNLADEPYWGNLTSVVEWAKDNTHSTIWSCLAAHAAILHLDGIQRRKSNEKRCGILECMRVSDHELMTSVPPSLKMPHSRWNDIPEDQLTACGYSVLTRTQDAGVDTFVRRGNSLFVFFQGHPEYESDTLLLEYRRDVARYLRGETDGYPSMPQTYFDQDTTDVLTAIKERAISGRREQLLADVATALAQRKIRNTWHRTARRVYVNWLGHLASQKERRLRRSKPAMKGANQEFGHLPRQTVS